MERLAKGLWRWTARHPEWHPGRFGAEVASFAVNPGGGTLLLIDPLLPEGEEQRAPVLAKIEEKLRDRLAILVTIPYHVRSSEELWRRYGKQAETRIHGHPACAKRLHDTKAFRPMDAGTELPAGVTAHRIGKPRRYELPLHLPSHRALVFGDAVAATDGRLVMWSAEKVDERVRSFYRDRFAPTLEPLLALELDSVLVTHGRPVLGDGEAALRAALAADPWYHHP